MIDLFVLHAGNYMPICDQNLRLILFSSLDDAELFRSSSKNVELYILPLSKLSLDFETVQFSLIEARKGVWLLGTVILKLLDSEDDDSFDDSINVNSPVLLNASKITLSDEMVAKKKIGKNFIRPFKS